MQSVCRNQGLAAAAKPVTRSSEGKCTSRDRSYRLVIRAEREERGRLPPRSIPAGGNKATKGFFGPADPKATVYSPGQLSREKDFTKRGGRWDEEFIWNTNWQEQLKYEEDYKRQQEEEEAKQKQEGGFLAISRLGDLNDPNVDLSEQFRQAKLKKEAEEKAKAERAKMRQARPKMGSQLPARFEAKRLGRGNKFGERVMAIDPTEGEKAEREATMEAERLQYEQLKQELSMWTIGLTVALFGATYVFYTRDVAASYGLGALGGYLYLRLLNKTVDGFGGAGGSGGPRLAIPVILVLGFNRFNELKADELNLHLQLLPMLAGFFTYKAAVIGKNFAVLARELVPEQNGAGDAAEGAENEQGDSSAVPLTDDERARRAERKDAALSVDRAFRDKILKG